MAMEVVYGIDNYTSGQPSCVTVGTFDGLHIGHRKILRCLVDTARASGLRSVVITFDPHPRQVLCPGAPVAFVLTQAEKIEAFGGLGIGCLVVHPFSMEFAGLSAEEFLHHTLVSRLNMRHLVKGFNNHFGCDRLSDVSSIRMIGSRAGFGVTQVEAEKSGDVQASSTLLRQLIKKGSVRDANRILGYPFPISGVVAHGRRIGRRIGFPTANIDVGDACKLIPAAGVYAAVAEIGGRMYAVMLNIGSNPTVNSDGSVLMLEAHIIGYSGDLYGRRICVRLIEHLREECKFPSLDALQVQLKSDQESVSAICRREFPQIEAYTRSR